MMRYNRRRKQSKETMTEERLVTEARASDKLQQKQGTPGATETAGSMAGPVVALLKHTEGLASAFSPRKK